MKPLTPTQRQVYDFLLAYLLEHHRSPAIREVCAAFGWKSPNGAMCHIRALAKKGWLDWESWRGDGWRFVGIQLRAEPVAEPQPQGAEHGGSVATGG